MKELGFIIQEILAVLGKSATMCKFINCCGCVQLASLEFLKPHHLSLSVVPNLKKNTKCQIEENKFQSVAQ